MSLRDRIWDDKADIESIGTYLDGLGAAERLAETRTLSRGDQRKLYQKAASAKPLDLEFFVPASTPSRTQVIHDGRNTLPLPGGLKLFQKRFARPESGGDRLFGYNQSPFISTIGPGFYVAVPTKGNAAWEERGSVVVDYFQIPDGPVPDGWPKVIPNSKGLQVFVYNKTRDFMRRVSSHVSVGAAYKVEKALDHYFMLCREG
ncbi:hypothetical protein A7982_12180 [Minicystis rosea]|nr:hypothetical protein A7982_12180 [Minicystis rosea]